MLKPPATQNTDALLTLNIKSVGLTDEQLLQLCSDNPELRFELTADKELLVMPPTGGTSGWRNSKLGQRLATWAEQDGAGLVFDSSTLFALPNGATRSPDAAWVLLERWHSLSKAQQDGIPPICPDFVAELHSPSDSLGALAAKLEEYIANGARLGWLIDPLERNVYIYRLSKPAERLVNPQRICGEDVLPGFALNPAESW